MDIKKEKTKKEVGGEKKYNNWRFLCYDNMKYGLKLKTIIFYFVFSGTPDDY